MMGSVAFLVTVLFLNCGMINGYQHLRLTGKGMYMNWLVALSTCSFVLQQSHCCHCLINAFDILRLCVNNALTTLGKFKIEIQSQCDFQTRNNK